MNYLTTLLEATNRNSVEPKVLSLYIDTAAKDMPDNVKHMLYLMKKYKMTDRDVVDMLVKGTSADMKKLKAKYNIGDNDLDSMKALAKQIDKEGNIRMLPQLQTKEETDNVIKGKITLDDVTLDLETEKGRDAVAKKYIPMVNAIARKYQNKSSLSYEELVSAGMMGLMQAMLDYHKPGDDEEKSVPFKQFASYRIGFYIMCDMDNSHTVRLPKSELMRRRKSGESLTSTLSLDKTYGDDDDSSLLDVIASTMPDEVKSQPEPDDKMWGRIVKFIDKNFEKRPASMFYKTIGINGFKRMKQTDIAKQMNCTPANVNMAVKKIVKAINDNPEMKKTITTLMGYTTEAILIDNYKDGKEAILEAFISNDLYLLLEEMTHWSQPDVLENALKNVLLEFSNDDAVFIAEALKNDFAWLDDKYNANKHVLVTLLEGMYPTETYRHKTDVSILNAFTKIADAYKSAGLNL